MKTKRKITVRWLNFEYFAEISAHIVRGKCGARTSSVRSRESRTLVPSEHGRRTYHVRSTHEHARAKCVVRRASERRRVSSPHAEKVLHAIKMLRAVCVLSACSTFRTELVLARRNRRNLPAFLHADSTHLQVRRVVTRA